LLRRQDAGQRWACCGQPDPGKAMNDLQEEYA
jgi:hypothetical protein